MTSASNSPFEPTAAPAAVPTTSPAGAAETATETAASEVSEIAALVAPPTRRRRRRRFLTLTASAAAVALVASGAAAVSIAHKSITMDVNGQVSQVSTFATSVADIISAHNITVGAKDAVIPGVGAKLSDGMSITIREAKSVTVAVNGVQNNIWTTAASAKDVLAMFAQQASDVALVGTVSGPRVNLGISLTDAAAVIVVADGNRYEVTGQSYDLTAALRAANVTAGRQDRVRVTANLANPGSVIVTVQRVVTQDHAIVTPVPFASTTVDDGDLYTGVKKVTQAGVNGQRTVVERVTTVDGVEESRTVISDAVTTAPVDKVTAIGTKDRPAAVSAASAPAVGAPSPGSAQALAQSMMASKYGWGDDQFACLVNLWQKESGWNTLSANSSSGAYGIPQALPGSKMAAFGADWRTNPATQIAWGLSYISGRYGNPCGAWSHFLAKRWY